MYRLTFAFAAALAANALPAFGQTGPTTSRAMPTCSMGDAVVWENTKTKAYHMRGDPYFGTTKHGRYACKSVADGAGYHSAGTHAGARSGMRPAMPSGARTAEPASTGFDADGTETTGPSTPKSSKHHHHAHGMPSPGPVPTSTY